MAAIVLTRFGPRMRHRVPRAERGAYLGVWGMRPPRRARVVASLTSLWPLWTVVLSPILTLLLTAGGDLAHLARLHGLWLVGVVGAILFKQAANNSVILATSVTVTWPASSTLGNCSVVVVGLDLSNTVTSVTDTGGSTYTQRATILNASYRCDIWSTTATGNRASASVTVNYSGGGNGDISCCIAEYSGVSALGVTATNTGTTANPTINLTTQDNNNFVVAGFASNAQAVYTANVGNLRTSTAGVGDGDKIDSALNDNTRATPGVTTNTVTHAASTWSAVALELRTLVSGGPAASAKKEPNRFTRSWA